MTDDFITFADEDSASESNNKEQTPKSKKTPWKIGIIDDEPQVHEVTILALRGITLYERELEFYSAYSGEEGEKLIREHPDMALVLLDVVMETTDAGLQLVDKIRNTLNNSIIQIVLRTGQAGYAPEEEVITRYEINSYKTKSELTRSKLFNSIATGLRSYQQLHTIEKSRKGLRSIIKASATLMQERSVHEFSDGVLTQIGALFNLPMESLFCISQRPKTSPLSNKNTMESYYIVATNDKFKEYLGDNIYDLQSRVPAIDIALQALSNQEHSFGEHYDCLYLSTPSGWEGAVVSDVSVHIQNADKELLQLFCLSVSLCLENVKYFTYLNKTAFTDELTGLCNQAGFITKGATFVKENQKDCALFIIDIDNFHKKVCTLGYEFANVMLRKMTETIKQCFNSNVIMARLHSDVFAVLTTNNDLSANDVATRCSHPVIVEQEPISIKVTVGSSVVKAKLENINIALSFRQAELALIAAKENKRGSGEPFKDSYDVGSK